MAGNDVNLTFTASERGMDAVFAKMMAALDKSMQKMDQLGTASEKVNRQKFDAHVKELEKATAAAEKLRQTEERQAQAMAQRSRFNQVASSERLAALRRTEAVEQERQERLSSGRSRFQQIATSERIAAFNRNRAAQVARRDEDVRLERSVFAANLAANVATKGFELLRDSLVAVADASRELRVESEQRMLSSDRQQRELQTQLGGETVEGRKEARKKVLEIAERNAARPEDVTAITKELAGSSFVDPLGSGTSEFAVQLAQSANLPPAEAPKTMQALGRFLVGFNKEKTNKNVMDLGLRLRGMYKDTTVQIKNAEAWSEAATTLSQLDIPLETSLSALGLATEKEEAAPAATGVRNVANRMARFGTSDEKTSVLERMGLKPEDVDLVGESFPEALAKLKTAMETLPKHEQTGAAAKLFEEAGMGTFFTLAEGARNGGFERFAKMQQDRKGFEEGVRINQSGPNAADIRRDVRKEKENFAREDRVALERERMQMLQEGAQSNALAAQDRGGFGGWMSSAVNAVMPKIVERMKDFGIDPVADNPLLSKQEKEMVDRFAKSNLAGRTKFSLDDTEAEMDAANARGGNVARGEAILAEQNRLRAAGGKDAEIARLQAELDALKAIVHGTPAQRKEGEAYLKQIADQTAARPAPAAHVPVAASARSRT